MSSLSQDGRSQIRNWMAKLADTDSLGPSQLAELESHLTDSSLELTSSGLSESEAIMVATSRVGDVSALASEYRKTDSSYAWTHRVVWICLGYVLLNMAKGMVDALAILATAFVQITPLATNSPMMLTPICLLGWVGVIWVLWRVVTRGRVFGFEITARRVVFTTVGLAALCAVVQIVGQIQMALWTPREHVGNVAIVRTYVSLVAEIMVPVALLIFANMLHKRKMEMATA